MAAPIARSARRKAQLNLFQQRGAVVIVGNGWNVLTNTLTLTFNIPFTLVGTPILYDGPSTIDCTITQPTPTTLEIVVPSAGPGMSMNINLFDPAITGRQGQTFCGQAAPFPTGIQAQVFLVS